MAAENHWKVKHLASFLILELVQMTQRQNYVTAFTLQFLVISLLKVTKTTFFTVCVSPSPVHALPGVLNGRSPECPGLVKLRSVAQDPDHPQLPGVASIRTGQVQDGVINLRAIKIK